MAMDIKIWGGERRENRWRKRVRNEEEESGAEGDNIMWKSLWNRGDWGIDGGSVIATQGEEREHPALLDCAG